MKFLAVDDNRLLNRFLTTYLRSKGHEASWLDNPTKVLNWLASNSCDAIIMDIGMPKIDGITLTQQIRENGYEIPIIIFTGLGYNEDAMASARKAGANGYISKQYGPSEIYSAIMRVLSAKISSTPANKGEPHKLPSTNKDNPEVTVGGWNAREEE